MKILFGDFELDEARFLLRRRGNGRAAAVALRPKVFDLLLTLVRNRHRVVLREELVSALWGGMAVGGGSLSGLVNELRSALGESGSGASCVRTVHARGYQFVAEVIGDSGSDAASPRPVPASLSRSQEGSLDTPRRGSSFDSRTPSSPEGRIRRRLARVPRSGASGIFIQGSHGIARAALCTRATEEAVRLGFEILRVDCARGGEPCGAGVGSAAETSVEADLDWLFARILEPLIESRGIDEVRASLPPPAAELVESTVFGEGLAGGPRGGRPATRLDRDRAWRGLGAAFRRLTRIGPSMLVFDSSEGLDAMAWQRVLGLPALLSKASVSVLVAGVGDERPTEAGPRRGEPCGDFARVSAAPPDRDALARLLEAEGVAPLPSRLAEALLDHADRCWRPLEPVLEWLATHSGGAAVEPSSPERRDEAPPHRRMRRVRPSDRSARQGGA